MTTFAVSMNSLEKYISDFLLLHDSLIVPKFGGFVSRKVAARFSQNSNKILPPSKQILFHSELHLADGILERYLSSRKKITLDASIAFINTAVTDWKTSLKKGDRLEFDKIGVFFQDPDGKLQFVQDRNQNLLLLAYGLGEIRYMFEGQQAPSAPDLDRPAEQAQVVTMLPIVHEETNTILEREETSTSISKKEKIVLIQEPVAPKGNSAKRFWIRAAAAAVVLPFLFYSFWVPLKTEVLETKTLAFIDFNPFYQIEKPLYQANKLEDIKSENNHIIDIDNIINSLPEKTQVFNFNYDAELIIPVQFKNITLIPSEINTNKPIAKDNEPAKKIENDILANNNSFHIISGCFSEKANADRHLKDLRSKGFDAYQVDVKGGLHRIAVGGSSNQQEAILLSQELKDQGLSVWTLRK